jgi:hypothetical protein
LLPTPTPRPHLAHWPARLPLELQVPATSLWVNLGVPARRYPHKNANLSIGNSNTLFKPDRPWVNPTPPLGSGLAHPSTA